MIFKDSENLLRVLIVGPLAYLAIIIVLRGFGKRSLAKLNAFDLVVTVALGSILATVLLSKDVTLAEGVLAFVLLGLLQWLVTRISVACPPFGRVVRAESRLLLRDGRFIEDAMREERVTREEIEQAIRGSGIGRIEQVAAVVLESDGSLSTIARDGNEPLTVLDTVRGA